MYFTSKYSVNEYNSHIKSFLVLSRNFFHYKIPILVQYKKVPNELKEK